MSSQYLEWHEECHNNFSGFLVRKQRQIYDLQCEVRRMEDEMVFYTAQINEARRRGMKKFDRTRFLKKRASVEALNGEA